MGKGGLNRVVLTREEAYAENGTEQEEHQEERTTIRCMLSASDPRAQHIHTVLGAAHETNVIATSDAEKDPEVQLRIAVEGDNAIVHDAAKASLLMDGRVQIVVPSLGRRIATPPPQLILLVAMQRPKVLARVLECAACLGVAGVVVVGADKVEKSYWQCRLLREHGDALTHGKDEGDESAREHRLPGRARNPGERYDGAPRRRRVDGLPLVRRRLVLGTQQAGVDGTLPWVALEPRGASSGLQYAAELHEQRRTAGEVAVTEWERIAAHVGATDCITDVDKVGGATGGSDGVVLAIGPEGGWTGPEADDLRRDGFRMVGLGARVLRSEMAVVVALGLVHERLRLRSGLQPC